MAVDRSRYVGPDGLEVVLEVKEPMGSGSGFIPPPIIEFNRHGMIWPFSYVGPE